ncbi:DNA polymerase III subunit beta [bacterium]|nr:MAG: DNA polymerase III subunit beta [bacterium]
MKIVCTKKNLAGGLAVASRVIGSGNALPVLNNILFKTDGGRLKLSSTNLEMAINTWMGGKIEEEGEITIPARLVNEYVNNLLTETITVTTEKLTIFLEGDKAKTHIKGLSSDEFPLIPQIKDAVFGRVESQDLKKAISEVGYAAAFSETQPEISGVLFSFKGKTLTLAATDRVRLAESQLPLVEDVKEERQVIIPVRVVHELAHAVGGGPVEIYLTENQAMFRSADTELITRLIEGQYPDYQQIIPKNFTTEAQIARSQFIQSLKAASLFASDSNNIEIEMNPQAKQLVVRSQSAQTGDSEIRIDAELTGQKNTIIFNHRYLVECLNNLGDEAVILKVIDSSSPAELVPAKREDFLYIVMPIKI